MLNAQTTQFKLNDDGRLYYQAMASNPLPGDPVAMLLKGRNILQPELDLLEEQPSGVKEHLQQWLRAHIATVLEPLVALENDEDIQGAARGIAFQVYEAMGIVPREQVESLIDTLDQDGRRALRNKKIRLGPILVFQPDLNKPAAVRLRALLWSLWNGKALPAVAPHDGVVSFKIDPAVADSRFYQAVGYPVYGPRAIRIDMLDRVINAIYEGAESGKFKAQHQMAEWLGCPIADLYEILHAMGHQKIFDPADQKPVEPVAQAEEFKSEESKVEVPQAQVKPELATFRLKKGKAFEKPQVRAPRPEKEKDRKTKPRHEKNKKEERPERIMSAGPKPKLEDSPFAVLGQLKVKKDAG